MEVPSSDSDWRSAAFRQKVTAQIEEAIRKAGASHTKSSTDMENHAYIKAKTREEYLSLVARLIIHFRHIHKKTQQGPVASNQNSTVAAAFNTTAAENATTSGLAADLKDLNI